MRVRGIGDTTAPRRLMWLFAGTVAVPAVLLGLMALGALGQREWAASAEALAAARARLPLAAELVARDLGAAATPEAVAAQAEVHLGLRGTEAPAVVRAVLRADAPAVGRDVVAVAPLPAPLDAYALVLTEADGRARRLRQRLQTGAALALLLLVLAGGFAAQRSAAREIRMSRRQTELVSRLSHELRTPMTAVRLFVDTLREGRLDPARTEEVLGLLSSESERLSRRIEEVLSWARMEAGARPYARDEVVVADVVSEAVAALRSQVGLEDPQLAVGVDVSAELPLVWGDHDALVEALLNLLVNAWRHTRPPRGIAVTARAAVRGATRGVALSVIDDGPGIPARDRDRIFEKFYRRDAEDEPGHGSGAGRGMGLGLAIVQAVATAHGGAVTVRSESGSGSTFTLWLPAAWSVGYARRRADTLETP